MARKKITREITHTTVKLAKMEIRDGTPVAVELPDETFIGNVKMERAQRLVDKSQSGATVLEVHPKTERYEMPVEVFMEHGTIVEETEQEETE